MTLLKGPFWKSTARLWSYRRSIGLAIVGAMVSAACFAGGLSSLHPIMTLLLGSEADESASLPGWLREAGEQPLIGPAALWLAQRVPSDPFWGFLCVLGALAVLTVIGSSGRFLHELSILRVIHRAQHDWRTDVHRHLLHTPIAHLSAHGSGDAVSRLGRASFDALFVPDAARQLNLIAPALAAADLWSVPSGQSAPRGGRAITLLAPGVALDPRVLRGSSRYLQGALFATPFHADTAQGAARTFVDEFEARFHGPPDTFSAYAYDAFRLVRRAVEAGETTREGVARWLREQGRHETVGASGGLAPARGPARPSRVLELRGEELVPLAPPDGAS